MQFWVNWLYRYHHCLFDFYGVAGGFSHLTLIYRLFIFKTLWEAIGKGKTSG